MWIVRRGSPVSRSQSMRQHFKEMSNWKQTFFDVAPHNISRPVWNFWNGHPTLQTSNHWTTFYGNKYVKAKLFPPLHLLISQGLSRPQIIGLCFTEISTWKHSFFTLALRYFSRSAQNCYLQTSIHWPTFHGKTWKKSFFAFTPCHVLRPDQNFWNHHPDIRTSIHWVIFMKVGKQ